MSAFRQQAVLSDRPRPIVEHGNGEGALWTIFLLPANILGCAKPSGASRWRQWPTSPQQGIPPCLVLEPRCARPSPSVMRVPKQVVAMARSRAGRRPTKARRARRRMRSSTACARSSISCCRTRTALSSPSSRRRWSRSWRRSARCRRCSRGGSRSPRGVSRGRTASRPSCSRSAAARTAGSGSPCLPPGGTGPNPSGGQATVGFEHRLGGRCAPTNRYRGAAMAEFWRALRTLKALQAEQALRGQQALGPMPPWRRSRSGPRRGHGSPSCASRTNPSAAPCARPQYVLSEPPASGALHEPAVPWLPNEPEAGAGTLHSSARPRSWGSNTTSSLMPSGSAKKTA